MKMQHYGVKNRETTAFFLFVIAVVIVVVLCQARLAVSFGFDVSSKGESSPLFSAKGSLLLAHRNNIQLALSRRDSIMACGVLITPMLGPTNAWAEEKKNLNQNKNAVTSNDVLLSSSSLESTTISSSNGLLESRVVSNVLSPPPYGMEGSDVFYPKWFLGTWKVQSETKDIQAPCGVALFGGNATYANALNDIGNILQYESRFVFDDNSDRIIADREYNVKSIAKVAMGENSVVDVATATPNKFSCLLAPNGSPSMLTVDLIVLNRRQEAVSANRFDCSEVVREIASPVDRPRQTPAILKEIETTSLYTYLPEKEEVHCRQRSAAFLLPSNENAMAMRMWQASGGRAIDIRYYDVTYTRLM